MEVDHDDADGDNTSDTEDEDSCSSLSLEELLLQTINPRILFPTEELAISTSADNDPDVHDDLPTLEEDEGVPELSPNTEAYNALDSTLVTFVLTLNTNPAHRKVFLL